MNRAKILTDYAMKNDKREDFMHSSAYAKAQAGGNFGASGAASFEARKAIDEQRKFVQGYKNSQLANSGFKDRARVYKMHRGSVSDGESGDGGENRFAPSRTVDLAEQAEKRAEFTTGRQDNRAKVMLGDARAPQVPNRRGGI